MGAGSDSCVPSLTSSPLLLLVYSAHPQWRSGPRPWHGPSGGGRGVGAAGRWRGPGRGTAGWTAQPCGREGEHGLAACVN